LELPLYWLKLVKHSLGTFHCQRIINKTYQHTNKESHHNNTNHIKQLNHKNPIYDVIYNHYNKPTTHKPNHIPHHKMAALHTYHYIKNTDTNTFNTSSAQALPHSSKQSNNNNILTSDLQNIHPIQKNQQFT
jgi:hypothetical protein